MLCRSKWLALAALVLLSRNGACGLADDAELLPKQLAGEERAAHGEDFLRAHEKPERFVPVDAKLVGGGEGKEPSLAEPPAGTPIVQFMAQIQMHRPVPGQEKVNRADIYYFRPNPEKGKPGIAVKYTVDLTTGKQVGATEVLLNAHTPLSREEVAGAVDLAKKQSRAVQALFQDPNQGKVRWEYLQLMVNRKNGSNDPGDRVARLVFTTAAMDQQQAPAPIRVIVNLTKGSVTSEPR